MSRQRLRNETVTEVRLVKFNIVHSARHVTVTIDTMLNLTVEFR